MTMADSNLLIFQVGPVPCCVDSNSVQIVIEPPEQITAIPGSNCFRPGLILHANRAVSVYDVRTKFNFPTDQRGVIIITISNNQYFGFWVDSIQTVTLASEGKWQLLPKICPREVFESVFMFNEQLIFKTNFDALANAQVNTQAQLFFNKILSEQKAKESTDSIDSPVVQHPNKTVTNKANTPLDKAKSNTKEPIKLPQEKTRNSDNAISTTNIKTKPNKPTSTDVFKNQNKIHSSKNIPSPLDKQSKTFVSNNYQSTNKISPVINDKTKPSVTPPKHQAATNPAQRRTNSQPTNNNRSSTTTKSTNNNKNTIRDINKTNNQSGITGVIFFIIFAISIAAFLGYLYLTFSSEKKRLTSQNTRTHTTPEVIANVTHEEFVKKPEVVINQPLEEFKIIEHETIQTESTFIDEQSTAEKNKSTKQPTEINHQDDTITITINDSHAEFNQAAEQTELPDQLNTDSQKIVIEEDIKPDNLSNQLDSKAESIEIKTENIQTKTLRSNKTTTSGTNTITHIIVKGDTLWHIAKRYVHNPYKYPQLARLSKIKNPDLIYPGNKVIIIIKRNKTH